MMASVPTGVKLAIHVRLSSAESTISAVLYNPLFYQRCLATAYPPLSIQN